MAKESNMTLNDALDILRSEGVGFSYGEIEQAKTIVRREDPNNPLLKAFEEGAAAFEQENHLESDDASLYMKNMEDINRISQGFDFDTFLKNNPDIKSFTDQTEIVEEGKKGQTTKLDRDTTKKYLGLLYSGARLKAEASLAGDPEFAKKDPETQKRAYAQAVKEIFFTDFARTAIASKLRKPKGQEKRIGSTEYKKYITQQYKTALNTISDLIVEGNRKITIKADSILSACADTAIQIERYTGVLRQKAQRLAQAGKKAIHDKFNKVASYFQEKKNQLEKTANDISKNRYEIWKNIKGSFSDNKIKLFGNVAANAAFGYFTAASAVAGGAATAPVLVPAVAAYAAYHVAGAWVYPIVAEMRKINRKKREAGEKTLNFKAALKEAFKNKTTNRKEKRTYLVGGLLNTAVAAVGFTWLKNGFEALDAARDLAGNTGINTSLAASIASTRHAISMGRAGTATAAQIVDASIAYGVARNDPNNKEKAEEFRQAAAAAVIGMGFNAIFQAVGANHAQAAEHTTPLADSTPNASAAAQSTMDLSAAANPDGHMAPDSLAGGNVDTAPMAPDSLATGNVDASQMQPVDQPEVEADGNVEQPQDVATDNDGHLFPRKHNKEEMGITKRQYDTLVKTTEGTLKDATGENVTLDRAYLNLNDDVMQNFPGKTREQVMYKFNRLYAFLRKSYEVGGGISRETPSGYEYLEDRLARLSLDEDTLHNVVRYGMEHTYDSKKDLIEGLKEILPDADNKTLSTASVIIQSNQRFYPQYAKEMEGLIGLLGCGKPISPEQGRAINELLDKTDSLLKTGESNTVLTGLSMAKGCHDDDGEWRHQVVAAAAAPEKKPVEIPFIEDRLEMQHNDTKIPIPTFDEPDPEPLPLASVPAQEVPAEPEPKQPKIRKLTTTRFSDLENGGADKQEEITGRRAQRMLRRAGRQD